MRNIVRSLTLLAVLLVVPALQAQDTPGRYSKTVSATGRTLLYTNPGPNVLNFTGTYYTTGTPTGVSVAIETGNVLAATSTPFGKIAALTNTTSAIFEEATSGATYWYVNVATLSGGTSPTVIVTYVLRPVLAINNTLTSGASTTGIVFEGATVDDFETTLSVTDPTADRAVTIPDGPGTVMLSSLASNAVDAANAVTGASNALVFEGATADGFEVSLSPVDPTVGDTTLSIPNTASVAASLMLSSLTTNTLEAANSVWGASNALVFEGATANAFELSLAPADATADATITLPDGPGTVMLSSLATNAVDAANSVTGASNALVFEGATANAFEISVVPADATADRSITLPDGPGTVVLSSLATNAVDAANSVTGASNALVFEGATADAFELSVSPTDVGADVTATLPGMGNAAYAVLGTSLTTNDLDVANSIWGVSNGIRFEGATADAFETTISPTDVGADVTVTLPGGSNAAYSILPSALTTNDVEIVNSVWGVSNGFRAEGATADASEQNITWQDPTADRTATFPNATGTVNLGFVTEVILCGQQANNGTIYMSPATGYQTAPAYDFGVAADNWQQGGDGCDTEDNATEATADEVMFTNNAFKVLGMYCSVSGSGTNGVTLNLRSAAASLTPDVTITIATGATTGAATTTTTTDVAAGATFALRVINTEDLSLQDAWCVAKILVVP